jgi:endonuclease YncB( thermonuclease family)
VVQLLRESAFVLFLAMLLGSAAAETILGRVVGVTDGDTITVLDVDKVQHKTGLVLVCDKKQTQN